MRVSSVDRVYGAYSAQASANVKSTGKVSKKDEVSLSTQAKDFTSIMNLLSDVPDVRNEKVQDIKNQIENGTYNVSSDQVASKILSQYNIRG